MQQDQAKRKKEIVRERQREREERRKKSKLCKDKYEMNASQTMGWVIKVVM